MRRLDRALSKLPLNGLWPPFLPFLDILEPRAVGRGIREPGRFLSAVWGPANGIHRVDALWNAWGMHDLPGACPSIAMNTALVVLGTWCAGSANSLHVVRVCGGRAGALAPI